MPALKTATYNFYKASEGGPVRRELVAALRAEGMTVRIMESIYVGQNALDITGTEAQHLKADRLIYGP